MIFKWGRMIATQNGQKKQVSQCDSELKTLILLGKQSSALRVLLPTADISEVEAVVAMILFMFT